MSKGGVVAILCLCLGLTGTMACKRKEKPAPGQAPGQGPTDNGSGAKVGSENFAITDFAVTAVPETAPNPGQGSAAPDSPGAGSGSAPAAGSGSAAVEPGTNP